MTEASSACTTSSSCNILEEYNSIDCVGCKQKFLIDNFLRSGENKYSCCRGSTRQSRRPQFEVLQCSGENKNEFDPSEKMKPNMIKELPTDPESTTQKKKNRRKKKKGKTAKSECISSLETKSQLSAKEDESTAKETEDSDSADPNFEKCLHQFCQELSHCENAYDQPRLVPNLQKEWLCELKNSIGKR